MKRIILGLILLNSIIFARSLVWCDDDYPNRQCHELQYNGKDRDRATQHYSYQQIRESMQYLLDNGWTLQNVVCSQYDDKYSNKNRKIMRCKTYRYFLIKY